MRPTWVGTAPGDRTALWVVEQPGRVLRLEKGTREVVLDLRSEVKEGAEQGLLGAAFDPDFAASHLMYLHWTARNGDTKVGEYRYDGGRLREVRRLLSVDQPEENHNGGQLAFGSDGRLYLGLGDGGGAFDPRNAAQDPSTKLGKLIAADTAGGGTPEWETVLYGLRNPWRFSFDSAMAEVWVADVGQDAVEEIDRVPLEPDEPPKNLGWPAYEGTREIAGRELRGDGEMVWPVVQYDHRQGCSVTGGLVYRGTRLASLAGRYIYGDFCTGTLWSLRPNPGGGAADVRREEDAKVPQLTHIGADASGELLFASLTGDIFRARPPASRNGGGAG